MMMCTLYYHCYKYCGLLVRNNLVKLVKFMFCLFLLPFWRLKLNILDLDVQHSRCYFTLKSAMK